MKSILIYAVFVCIPGAAFIGAMAAGNATIEDCQKHGVSHFGKKTIICEVKETK